MGGAEGLLILDLLLKKTLEGVDVLLKSKLQLERDGKKMARKPFGGFPRIKIEVSQILTFYLYNLNSEQCK